MNSKKPGRPSTVTVSIKDIDLKAADSNIKQFFKSKVRPFPSSGAYIPISQEYENHDVFVIVMDKK